MRVALFDDELALGVIDDHVVLVRLLLRHDLLALEVPVAFGVRVFDFALDLAAHAFVAFELLWQALGELERWLFYVQVARCLFVLVDHARVLAFVLFNVLRDAKCATTAELLLRDLVALIVRLFCFVLMLEKFQFLTKTDLNNAILQTYFNWLSVLKPLWLAIVMIDKALEHSVLSSEDVHLSR